MEVIPNKKIGPVFPIVLIILCAGSVYFHARALDITALTNRISLGFAVNSIVVWLAFSFFLREFSGTTRVANALLWMAISSFATGALIYAVGTAPPLLPASYKAIIAISMAGTVTSYAFYLLAAIFMIRTTGSTLRLKWIGVTILISLAGLFIIPMTVQGIRMLPLFDTLKFCMAILPVVALFVELLGLNRRIIISQTYKTQ